MVAALFKGLFSLITKLFNLILTPIVNAIMLLFPSSSVFFGYIISFFDLFFDFIPLVRTLMFIPVGAISMLFDYYLILYTIYGVVVGVKFAITIYNKLKI